MSLPADGPGVWCALSALSYRLPQHAVERFLDESRRRLTGGAGPCWLTLVVDEWEGVHDLGRLAALVDVLSFSPRRRGFGVARTTALQEGWVSAARWVGVVDADGQHDPATVARLLSEADSSDWDAVIPQRTLIDLPLRDGGGFDRVLAERFEAYVTARAAGRDDCAHLDLQPGLLLMRREAAHRVLRQSRARRYEWDLEAAHVLLSSGLRIGFPPVASCPQPVTFFESSDSLRNVRFLGTLVGFDRVRTELEGFRALAPIRSTFDARALDALSRHVEEALRVACADA